MAERVDTGIQRLDPAETGFGHLHRREHTGLECRGKFGDIHLMRFVRHRSFALSSQ